MPCIRTWDILYILQMTSKYSSVCFLVFLQSAERLCGPEFPHHIQRRTKCRHHTLQVHSLGCHRGNTALKRVVIDCCLWDDLIFLHGVLKLYVFINSYTDTGMWGSPVLQPGCLPLCYVEVLDSDAWTETETFRSDSFKKGLYLSQAEVSKKSRQRTQNTSRQPKYSMGS